jgi:hypothetical protein
MNISKQKIMHKMMILCSIRAPGSRGLDYPPIF